LILVSRLQQLDLPGQITGISLITAQNNRHKQAWNNLYVTIKVHAFAGIKITGRLQNIFYIYPGGIFKIIKR
jgi:hypothetical protein